LPLLLFLSCRTFSPVRERSVPPSVFGGIDAIVPRWAPRAEESGQGLAVFAGKLERPRLEFWALRADLNAPGLSVVVSGPEPVGGEFRENHMPAAPVSLFAERRGCAAAINAAPFSPVSAKTGEDRFIDGITVSKGVLVARPNPRFDALVFYGGAGAVDAGAAKAGGNAPPGKRAAILSQGELLPGRAGSEGMVDAVGGFLTVLREGVPVKRVLDQEAGGNAPRHPRSAAGLSPDGNTLYLLAVDGRRPGSVGATEAELARILKSLGASEGLNFDGGGSTALVLRSPGPAGRRSRIRPVNIPIHRQVPGWERAVASCLGIRTGGNGE
jgi:hypothetical protein